MDASQLTAKSSLANTSCLKSLLGKPVDKNYTMAQAEADVNAVKGMLPSPSANLLSLELQLGKIAAQYPPLNPNLAQKGLGADAPRNLNNLGNPDYTALLNALYQNGLGAGIPGNFNYLGTPDYATL